MSMEEINQAWHELEPHLRHFRVPKHKVDLEELIPDYAACRALITQIEEDEDFREWEAASQLEVLKSSLIEMMNDNIRRIASCVYEAIRSDLEDAKTTQDRVAAIAAGKPILDALEMYPEHAGDPFFRKVLRTIEDYESKLDDALVEEQEAEFQRAMAGIEYSATKKQVKYLLSLGAKPRQLEGITKEKASAMITRLTNE